MTRYDIRMVRRQSKNNGFNFCKYAVICDAETGEVVRDDNKRYDRPEHLAKVKQECEEINQVGDYGEWVKQREERLHKMFLESVKR